MHTGRALWREETRWILSRWWITGVPPHASVQDQICRAASLQAWQEARATTLMEAIVERGGITQVSLAAARAAG